jgi:zinc transporter ZupT
MASVLLLITIVAFISTFVGGLVVFKFRHSLPYIFAYAAGSLIAVAFIDLLPESLELAESANVPIRYILITVVLSFFLYNFIERFFATHHMHEHDHDDHEHVMGPIGAGSLVIHSFLDGAAIGAAFQINQAIGIVVGLAVIFHDFTDGINTVTVMLRNHHSTKHALIFLALDAIAPVAGVLTMMYLSIPPAALAFLLAFFAGEFIYIGAASLVPETKNTSKKTLLAMAFGIAVIIVLTAIVAI